MAGRPDSGRRNEVDTGSFSADSEVPVPLFTYRMSSASSGSQSHELELPDEDSARVAAKFVARVFAADNVQSGLLDLSRVLSVSDQVGRTVHSMPLSEAIEVSGV